MHRSTVRIQHFHPSVTALPRQLPSRGALWALPRQYDKFPFGLAVSFQFRIGVYHGMDFGAHSRGIKKGRKMYPFFIGKYPFTFLYPYVTMYLVRNAICVETFTAKPHRFLSDGCSVGKNIRKMDSVFVQFLQRACNSPPMLPLIKIHLRRLIQHGTKSSVCRDCAA